MIRTLLRDERGAALVEMLIAFPLVLLVFLSLFELTHIFAADLIVKRAASAAARAAIVFLGDSPAYHEGGPPRESFPAEAARRVLLASPHLDPNSLNVAIAGQQRDFALLTATVTTSFSCAAFISLPICGLDGKVPLRAQATLPIQMDR
jgi:Flp pilus assembly protein TadG